VNSIQTQKKEKKKEKKQTEKNLNSRGPKSSTPPHPFSGSSARYSQPKESGHPLSDSFKQMSDGLVAA